MYGGKGTLPYLLISSLTSVLKLTVNVPFDLLNTCTFAIAVFILSKGRNLEALLIRTCAVCEFMRFRMKNSIFPPVFVLVVSILTFCRDDLLKIKTDFSLKFFKYSLKVIICRVEDTKSLESPGSLYLNCAIVPLLSMYSRSVIGVVVNYLSKSLTNKSYDIDTTSGTPSFVRRSLLDFLFNFFQNTNVLRSPDLLIALSSVWWRLRF
jgi:hypothetical protein